MENAFVFFEQDLKILENSLKSIRKDTMKEFIDECAKVIQNGHRIIASGLGKNVPICEKFVGTMISLGLNAGFLHTNSAVHGDLGMIHSGDLVIVLTKSGSTQESVYLVDLLKKRENVHIWLMSCNENGVINNMVKHQLIITLEHEGDMWNIMPNNSTTLFLIILQKLAMELAKKLNITLDEFRINHPGGAIGEKLKHE